MTIKKKGQAAMEFLMTYGWALLVVLIVIAALAFFGLLNPSRFLPEKCEIAPGLTCADFNAQYDGISSNITLLLNNGLGQSITVTSINLTDCITDHGDAVTHNTGFNKSHVALAQGSTASYTINCSNSDAVPGGRFRTDVVFSYNTTVEGTTLNHVKSGYLVVEVEE